jgi:trimeric autotransporter adhesin
LQSGNSIDTVAGCSDNIAISGTNTYQATARGCDNIAIGRQSVATGTQATTLGGNAVATGDHATAIGAFAGVGYRW